MTCNGGSRAHNQFAGGRRRGRSGVSSGGVELLDLKPGMVVALSVDEGRLVVQTQNRSKYTLQELLDQCDFSLPVTTEEREWLDAPAVGEEVL